MSVCGRRGPRRWTGRGTAAGFVLPSSVTERESVLAVVYNYLCRARRSPTGNDGDRRRLQPFFVVVDFFALDSTTLQHEAAPPHTHTPPRHRPLPALTLRSPSPLLRPLHPPAAAPAPDDFVLYPSFLSEDEQDVLVRMALSKLSRSRAGAARRARRQRAGAGVAADGSGNGLQRLFTGEYAFEEVRSIPCTITV